MANSPARKVVNPDTLGAMADLFENGHRVKMAARATSDDPEGSLVVLITDTLAKQLAASLRRQAMRMAFLERELQRMGYEIK